jgi:hypothetical protein
MTFVRRRTRFACQPRSNATPTFPRLRQDALEGAYVTFVRIWAGTSETDKFLVRLLLPFSASSTNTLTAAFGGQRFGTEAFERLGAVGPQILPRLVLRGGLFFIWKRLPTYWNCLSDFSIFFKCVLKSLDNQADFDSAIPRFDPLRHSVRIAFEPCNPIPQPQPVAKLRFTRARPTSISSQAVAGGLHCNFRHSDKGKTYRGFNAD